MSDALRLVDKLQAVVFTLAFICAAFGVLVVLVSAFGVLLEIVGQLYAATAVALAVLAVLELVARRVVT